MLEGIAGEGRRNIAGQYDLFGGEAEDAPAPPSRSRTPRSTRAASLWRWKRETTGLYLSGHPMDEYRDAARAAGAVNIGAILSDFSAEGGPERFADGQIVTLAGIVASRRTRTTKNGALMALRPAGGRHGQHGAALLPARAGLRRRLHRRQRRAAGWCAGRISVRDGEGAAAGGGQHPAHLRRGRPARGTTPGRAGCGCACPRPTRGCFGA